MRLITLEDAVYKVEEKDFTKIVNKHKSIYSRRYYNGQDLDMQEFIDNLKPNFNLIGYVEFDFRL
ncbi:MAG: hypothetical protein CMH22_05655 [Methylophaga sp.]|nr:hypothetical protein [Methylophaga sp.]|tara:strand:+ start:101135 stop:101329 length:195 start_codon:yes stop_codon:yes gene_type:complete